jgi:transposase
MACGYTDLRCGIDGLACIVREQFKTELDEKSLFLFCGRRTDRIKGLLWCGDGYLLLYKRLTNGRFNWPRSQSELRNLDEQSFRWLMEGLSVEQPKAIRKMKQREMY